MRKMIAIVLVLAIAGIGAKSGRTDGKTEIEEFNKRYVELHLKMDTAGILALWAEDGVDLMPGDEAMVGGHCGQDAGLQSDEAGDGVPRYSCVWGMGFGVGDRAPSRTTAGGKAAYRNLRKNGVGVASRCER